MSEIQFKLPKDFYGRLITDENIEIGEKERLLLEAYVPGIEIITNYSNFNTTIYYKKSSVEKMVVKDSEIIIYGKWKNELSLDIYHLISALARKHYLSNNLFPVHAACIGLEKLILLTGHTSSGKTTISLNLIEKYGMKMFSGNKTIIDLSKKEPLAILGTKTITMDKRYSNNTEVFEYGNRIAFRLDKEKYVEGGSLSCIVLVRLNDGVQDWIQLSQLSALHTLYPYFLDLANADIVIGKNIFDGKVDLLVREYLVRKLQKTLEGIPVYLATGSLSFISDKIGGLNI